MRKFILLSSLSLLLASCSHRSADMVWQDAKTAGRYLGKSLRALRGAHGDSRLIHHPYEFQGPQDEEYIPIDSEMPLNRGEFALAQEEPGDTGSFLPGIEGFREPNHNEEGVFTPVYFNTDKDWVKNKDGLRALKKVAAYLKKNPNYYVFIEGHFFLYL